MKWTSFSRAIFYEEGIHVFSHTRGSHIREDLETVNDTPFCVIILTLNNQS